MDVVFFREINPNYAKASIYDLEKEHSSGDSWIILGKDDESKKSSDSIKSTGRYVLEVKGDDLLICSPTVLGFSLGIKIWGEHSKFPRKVPSS